MTRTVVKKTLAAIAIILILMAVSSLYFIKKVFWPNIVTRNTEYGYLYIRTGSTLNEVANNLYQGGFLLNRSSFEWLAEKKGYDKSIKAGKYKIRNGMSNNELINLLRSGRQERVKVSFSNIRHVSQLAGIFGNHLEADSADIVRLFSDIEFLSEFDLSPATAISVFIPNTYYFFWNTSAPQIFKRMYTEYKSFWNENRMAKAAACNLSPVEVITLASIINEESNMSSEYPIIAGVYMNRLKKGMPLQADPTVKFAVGDFSIKRVLTKHIEKQSAYNTYKVKGLPPGPISLPSIKAIDAVLNYEKHQYLYFCARADMSGYHAFAKTLTEHNQNARAFQNELNKRRIYR